MGCSDCSDSEKLLKTRAERAELGWTRAAAALLQVGETAERFAAVASEGSSTTQSVIDFVHDLTMVLDAYNRSNVNAVEQKQAKQPEIVAVVERPRTKEDFSQAAAKVGRTEALRLGLAVQRHRSVRRGE